jgi:asparagine synthase (glutamine-hydrolysing)
MSGIAAIARVDGGPVDPAAIARLTATLARRGPDGEGVWVDGGVGLGHRLLQTTPESLGEKQPVSDQGGDCRLVWDGRLDNRDELRGALGQPNVDLGRPDPELALAAYHRWGDAFLARLVGDFALVLWDRRRRRLLCARDPLGAKPLCYRLEPERLLLASEAAPILSAGDVPVRPNEAMIADFLLMEFRDHAATFFEGVQQLPPGHVLTVEDGRVSVGRYWDLPGTRPARAARAETYLEEFRVHFREAVRCRLRSQMPLAVLLSGGIDSTAVGAQAEAIRRVEPASPALSAVTLVGEDFLREEREAIDALARAYGTDLHAIPPAAGGVPVSKLELYLFRSESPHYDGFMTVPLVTRAVTGLGARALLTGFGADELIGATELGWMEDLLRGLRPAAFAREARRLALAYGARPLGSALGLARGAVPARLRRAVKRAAGQGVPRWLDPGFARRAQVAHRTPFEPPRRFPTRAQEAGGRAITSPALALGLTSMEAAAANAGLEVRHPFVDRRLVEFFLSIPPAATMRYGYRKMFLQEAVRPVSPAPPRPVESSDVLIPPRPHRAWAASDREWLGQTLFSPKAPVFAYVDRREAERLRDRYLAGEERCRTLLRRFAMLELWLRDFVEGRP